MLDIRFLRENPELVKENIRKKFQNAKLPLVDEAVALDAERRDVMARSDELKAERNKLSKANGPLFGQLKKCEDPARKAELEAQIAANNDAVRANAEELARLDGRLTEVSEQLNKIMLVIPQMIDPSVPIGPDDSCNVEVQRFGEPKVPNFEIPYHTDIMERFDGIDLDAAGRVSGNGFYYLMGDIARLHSAMTAYARDFMIGKGFTYCIPP
ncbi:MAG: serine--tRNA ligase, partial [Oscillospiraceae bacterium]|nr:serine--tRNA ligase [Oscillospiraceae bacterium]